MAKPPAPTPFRDDETTRRNAIMMRASFAAFVFAGAATVLLGHPWPAVVAIAGWYVVWLVWVTGVFEH